MISKRFPLSEKIQLSSDLEISAELVLKIVGPLLTPERQKKIDQVVDGRTFSAMVIGEDIYDRGNISAVMRSMEAMGFGSMHLIETGEKFKAANRVTQGADKWVEVKKWKSTTECVKAAKENGYQVVVTSLEASRPIFEVDFTKPTALVLGNEKEGVSAEMLSLADERIIIPMQGFVQSFNISVAGALCMYHIYSERVRKFGRQGDLSDAEKNILKAHYYLRTQPSAEDVLKELFNRGQLLV
jgi:tRNA (guanosine-2'-O-)-methyltransferase